MTGVDFLRSGFDYLLRPRVVLWLVFAHVFFPFSVTRTAGDLASNFGGAEGGGGASGFEGGPLALSKTTLVLAFLYRSRSFSLFTFSSLSI